MIPPSRSPTRATRRSMTRPGEGCPSLRAVEERDDRGGQRRCDVDVVVGQARQDREAMVCHPGAVPGSVALAATEQTEELDRMRRWQPVRVTDHEHDGIDRPGISADQ